MDYSKLAIVLILVTGIGLTTWIKVIKRSHGDEDFINEIAVPELQEPDNEEIVVPDAEVSSYEEALKKAKENNSKIFLYFGATWCGPCQQMKSKTFPNNAVKKALESYVVCILDVDSERKLASKYKLIGVPSYYIIDKDENVEKKDSGFKSPAEFSRWLK